ncbi:MAG: S-layer homology domain-containing protein [Bacillota bacterium]|nr:S-layer homology domain-containing protein [Bacillota bacterium]
MGDNGLIGISKEGFEGYINTKGETVLTLGDGYCVQGPFSEGKASVVKDTIYGKYGDTAYINREGRVVLKGDRKWYFGGAFKNNIAYAANTLGKGGIMSRLLIRYTGDIPSEWAEESVNKGKKSGIIPDSLQSLYRENITRVEFCELAYCMLQKGTSNEFNEKSSSFLDTDSPAVAAMYNAGIINGRSETEFSPYDFITREEAAKILSGIFNYMKIPKMQVAGFKFSDEKDISDWAKTAVYNMYAAKIMLGTGDNMFSPQDGYTREQAEITMVRIYNYK